MPTQSALTLVDALLAKTLSTEAPALADAVRQQVAFVRALIDEVDRHGPESRRVVPARDQLGDELLRLAQLLERTLSRGEAAGPERVLDVLVVDDDADARRAAAAVLHSLGYPCRTAADGEAALREFDREPAAIVLTDWSMPGMSGLTLCSLLKRRERRPYVIVATAFPDEARLVDGGVRGGADDFLRKPLDVEELTARLLSATRLLRAVDTLTALDERRDPAALALRE